MYSTLLHVAGEELTALGRLRHIISYADILNTPLSFQGKEWPVWQESGLYVSKSDKGEKPPKSFDHVAWNNGPHGRGYLIEIDAHKLVPCSIMWDKHQVAWRTSGDNFVLLRKVAVDLYALVIDSTSVGFLGSFLMSLWMWKTNNDDCDAAPLSNGFAHLL